MDMNSTHMAMVEWSGTFYGVLGGTVSLYGWMEKDTKTNLAKFVEAKVNFTAAKFVGENWMVTANHGEEIQVPNFLLYFELHISTMVYGQSF